MFSAHWSPAISWTNTSLGPAITLRVSRCFSAFSYFQVIIPCNLSKNNTLGPFVMISGKNASANNGRGRSNDWNDNIFDTVECKERGRTNTLVSSSRAPRPSFSRADLEPGRAGQTLRPFRSLSSGPKSEGRAADPRRRYTKDRMPRAKAVLDRVPQDAGNRQFLKNYLAPPYPQSVKFHEK